MGKEFNVNITQVTGFFQKDSSGYMFNSVNTEDKTKTQWIDGRLYLKEYDAKDNLRLKRLDHYFMIERGFGSPLYLKAEEAAENGGIYESLGLSLVAYAIKKRQNNARKNNQNQS